MGGDAVVQSHDSCVDDVTVPISRRGNRQPRISDGEYWRREVASRLERYRARRKPRAPRYPSLRLPFDSADNWLPVNGSALAVASSLPAASALSLEDAAVQSAVQSDEMADREVRNFAAVPSRIVEEPEHFTNVIEFPRWAAIPITPADELAETIVDRPRIVEAPEVLPPPPALGGLLMESGTAREPEKKLSADHSMPSASIPRRLLASLLDCMVLGVALVGFGAMFAWLNPQPPPLSIIAAAVGGIGVLLWAAYQFLFVVYTGSTPGLQLARLQLTRFDGSSASRSVRRWRVLASYLSALALGFGYLWSLLDEDGLCWHDRITRTHLS